MKTEILRSKRGERKVTKEAICAAMNEFDLRFRAQEDETGTLYAVDYDGKRYPPKRILAIATDVPVQYFWGGEPSNRIFRSLGFDVLKVKSYRRTLKTNSEVAREKRRLKLPVPHVNTLIEKLFAQKWIRLHEDFSKLADSEYPGVYVLAYSASGLQGKQVKEKEIYYVGVSHAGVKGRLKQFITGLEDAGHHSGAKRFFYEVAKQVPYPRLKGKKTFFVASKSVPCTYLKKTRTGLDLRKLGAVAEFEWYVLARVKEKTGNEPWLNKK